MHIICIAFPAWDGNYLKSTVQLMKEMAKSHHVLYVDYAYTWKDFFQSLGGKGFASWRRMIGIDNRLREVTTDNGSKLHVLTLPPVIPANFIKNESIFDGINSINAFFIKRAIQAAQRKLNMTSPVVINAFNPFFGVHMSGAFGEKQLIYYCYDEIGAANWAKQHGARLENRFMKMVDTVIVTSQGLFNKKSKQHPDCHLVKNGVDYHLFANPTVQTIQIPLTLNNSYSKTIGYLGSVDERLDYDLIESVIKATPQYRYVFVGRITESAYENRLKQFKNVVLIGSQPPDMLPAWVNTFDVCWIPFILNDLTAGIYPLKINEYLAANKPVVSTRFADLTDFEPVIDVATTTANFVKYFDAPSQTDMPRQDFSARNDWSARAELFLEVIDWRANKVQPLIL